MWTFSPSTINEGAFIILKQNEVIFAYRKKPNYESDPRGNSQVFHMNFKMRGYLMHSYREMKQPTGVNAKSIGSGARMPEFESWLCHVLAV